MNNIGNLKLTTPGNCEIAITRVFDAPRRLVFDAFTKPDLVKQWLLGPPGWSMPVCEIDLKVGMGGVYREVVPQERLVCTELFDEAWYPGESLITTTLAEQGRRTTLMSTILYVSQEARDAVLKSGMERGVAASYDRLAELLASLGTLGMEKSASPS